MARSLPTATRAAIGCTQATEIRYTPGLALVAPLPPPFDLATVYSAALTTNAADSEAAAKFIALLGADASRRCAAPAASTTSSRRRRTSTVLAPRAS